jgi:ribosome-binding protein aMBF1 (putative translation factor)
MPMTKKGSKNQTPDIQISTDPRADLIIDGEPFEYKSTAIPAFEKHARDVEIVQKEITRQLGHLVRHGSKAQWYCSVDESDVRAKKFARAVKLARTEKGWNQAECAKKLSISQPQFSTLESGTIEPLPSKVFEIEKMFGLKPGAMSSIFGYYPHGGEVREVILQTAEKLDNLVVMGEYAIEQVLMEDRGASLVEDFIKDAEDVGLDAIAAIAKVSNKLLKAVNTAVSEALPKVFAMKQAEMSNLSSRIISLIDNAAVEEWDYDRAIREAREQDPHLDMP